MNLTDKTIWITGASSGIGEALTYAFTKAGAGKIILSGRRIAELERVKNNCTGSTEIITQVLDVAKHDEIPSIAQSIENQYGTIDVLVNNAGISQRGTVLETGLDVDKRIMDVDYFGTVAMTKAVLPKMVEKGNGMFITMSSLSGKMGVPQRSAYCGAKHALHGFFDALRAENTHHGIKVLLVCPGYIRTDISKNALTSDGKPSGQMDDNQENGMSPEDLAQRILKAIRKEEREIYVGGKEKLGVYLKRFFPGVLAGILAKRGKSGEN
jgi:short-subunit dehydrogenase